MRTLKKFSVMSVLFAACGGAPRTPVAPNPVARAVTFTAYLDENRNRQLDAFELIRIPGAEVMFGTASGKSAPGTGEVLLSVLQTSQSLSVTPSSLPPYYIGPDPALVTPPLSGPLNVPISLPLGAGATPGVFLAFGDSITNGRIGVGDGQGYTGDLEKMLQAHFGKARVINDGLDGSNTERGDSRLGDSLEGGRPAFTLILYGTNDWADPRCGEPPCFTIERLRSMVRKVKARGGFAFVGTLLMLNVGNDFRASPQRNSWVSAQNEFIRQMAREEDVVLVDLHRAFEVAPYEDSQLFSDYIHPSAVGYRVLADAWFEAITKRR